MSGQSTEESRGADSGPVALILGPDPGPRPPQLHDSATVLPGFVPSSMSADAELDVDVGVVANG